MRRTLRRWTVHVMRRLNDIKPMQLIVVMFALIILTGTLLLMLPASSKDGQSADWLTALFTATSATCVTGLTLVDTYVQWSGFGQIVILALIQVGGLGFMTIASIIFFLFRKKIGLKQRIVMAQALSLNQVSGVIRIVRHVLFGTLLIESAGALILAVRFAFDVPIVTAIKWGIFHSVSAFCNAGFDILGQVSPGTSLMPYVGDPVVCLTIMALIVIGGVGFFVWEDLIRWKRSGKLSIHTKLVLCITVGLIVGGAALVAILEWKNPATLGALNTGDKVLAAGFQSVTTRTAGFFSIDQGAMTEATKAVCIALMLIGGSPGSTAGGIKTVTAGVLLLSVVAVARGRKRVRVFKRSIMPDQVSDAMAIVLIMGGLAFCGALYISATNPVGFVDALFETVSALATVGLTANITPLLSAPAQLLLVLFMFFGRVGVMTISLGFLLGNRAEEKYQYAETRVMIG